MQRKDFIAAIPLLAFVPRHTLGNYINTLPISANTYNWVTFYRRKGRVFGENLDADLKEFAFSGIKAIEPSFDDVNVAKKYLPFLKKYNLALPSIYVNSTLHEKNAAQKSIDTIIETAKEVKKYGTKIIVTNPNPIEWGASEKIKNDEQLTTQVQSLNTLGKALKGLGLTLAYHTHDMEMKAGAREFHHMMQNTDPRFMAFCFDLHWVYRGSGNSALAVYDVLKMYGNRIAELHVRQSTHEIWNETFKATGDIDYDKIVKDLRSKNIHPHIVIEQCIENGSPETVDAIEAHKIDFQEIKKTFKL